MIAVRMDDRKPPQLLNGSHALTLDQLDRRIQSLEQEIPLYSNRAAEAMVQGLEDNSFRLETEKRLEELNRLKEERRRMRPDGTPGSDSRSLQPSPVIPGSSIVAASVPAPGPMLPKAFPQQQPSRVPAGGQVPQVLPNGTQQPPISRKQKALERMNGRIKGWASQNCVVMCSPYLDYHDHVALACVSKGWRHLWRKSSGWRRLVLNLEATMQGHVSKITAVSMFDPTTVVSGSADGKVKFWDMTKQFVCVKTLNITPSPLHRFIHPRIKEAREASGHGFGVSHDGNEEEFAEYPLAVTSLLTVSKFVLIGAEDGRLIVWMAGPEKKEFEYQVHRRAISCMVHGSQVGMIFTGSMDGNVAAINTNAHPFNPTALPTWPTPLVSARKHDGGVTAVAFAAGVLFSGSSDGKIYAWNPRNMVLHKILTIDRTQTTGAKVSEPHQDRVTSMVGHDDRLFTAAWDSSIRCWNARTLELMKEVAISPIGICWSLAIRREAQGLSLVAGVRDTDVCVIDAETLEMVSGCEVNQWAYRLDRHQHWVKSIYASPDGRIITGSDDWQVKVWSPRLTSSRGAQAPFAGLPPGPLSKEDAECLCVMVHRKPFSQKYADILQEQKTQYDKSIAEKRKSFTPEQQQQFDQQNAKYAEQWATYRERYKQALASQQGGGVAAASSSSATPGATTTTTTTATTSTGVVADMSATPSAMVVETPKASTTPGAALLSSLNGEGAETSGTPAAGAQPSSEAAIDDGSTVQKDVSDSTVKQEPDENGLHAAALGIDPSSNGAAGPSEDAAVSASASNEVAASNSDFAADPNVSSVPTDADASSVPAVGDGETALPSEPAENGGEEMSGVDNEGDEEGEDGEQNGSKRRKIAK